MRKRYATRSVLLFSLLIFMMLGMRSESSPQSRRFAGNKLAVRQVEMGYSLGEPSLRVRLHLESGQAIERELSQGTDTDYFLTLTQIMSSRGGRMFAEVTDNELVGVQIAVQ